MPVPQAIGGLLSGEFDIFLNGMGTGVAPETLLNNYTLGNPNNYAKWSNQDYTDLMNESKAATDFDAMFCKTSTSSSVDFDESPVSSIVATRYCLFTSGLC